MQQSVALVTNSVLLNTFNLIALQARRSSERVQREKQISLSESNKKLLHDSWHFNPTTKPYVEIFIKVIEENK